MVALYTVWYDFARINSAVKCSPAMAAGLSPTLWDVGDIVKLVEAMEISRQSNCNSARSPAGVEVGKTGSDDGLQARYNEPSSARTLMSWSICRRARLSEIASNATNSSRPSLLRINASRLTVSSFADGSVWYAGIPSKNAWTGTPNTAAN